MDYATFIRQAEKGEPPAITLLHGGDVQLLDDALHAATRGLFPDRALAAWGREVFDGREARAAAIIELPTRGARDLAGWVRQRAALEGLTITDEAARLLVELTGEDTAT